MKRKRKTLYQAWLGPITETGGDGLGLLITLFLSTTPPLAFLHHH
jgi:hypothetical protein